MTRDNDTRLQLFSGGADGGCDVSVRRLALNRDQVRKYRPPPNPAKLTDSRATGYLKEHGNKSWELDALSPDVIAALITSEIESLLDQVAWDEAVEREDKARARINTLAEKWKD